MEDLEIGGSSVVHNYLQGTVTSFKPVLSNGVIFYQIPQQYDGSVLSIFNIAGKLVMAERLKAGSRTGSVSLAALPSGMYTLIHSVNGKAAGEKIKFAHIQ